MEILDFLYSLEEYMPWRNGWSFIVYSIWLAGGAFNNGYGDGNAGRG